MQRGYESKLMLSCARVISSLPPLSAIWLRMDKISQGGRGTVSYASSPNDSSVLLLAAFFAFFFDGTFDEEALASSKTPICFLFKVGDFIAGVFDEEKERLGADFLPLAAALSLGVISTAGASASAAESRGNGGSPFSTVAVSNERYR